MQGLKEQISLALGRAHQGTSDFELNPETILPAGRRLRPAGVLLGITTYTESPQVILTKRSSALKHHPGQIAFPGGKVDASDADETDAALREAWEEIGLPQDLPHVIGTLPGHETVTGFLAKPVVALIPEPFEIKPEAGEVAEVFSIPLSHVLEPESYLVQSRRWRGQRRHFYVVPYGPYYIWGATARMLRGFADAMGNEKVGA